MTMRPNAGEVWQQEEIDLLLEAYFELMEAERSGRRPVKANFNRRLQRELPARSRGSIEYKLQNVSAALERLGFPWIEGYKPARNFQAALGDSATAWLQSHAEIAEQLATYGDAVPESRAALPLEVVLVPPPVGNYRSGGGRVHLSRGEWGALKDARNRALGAAGEEWVVSLERNHLRASGRDALARRVERVSQSVGDGLGYDVLSFDPEGSEKLIEVKTTNFGPRSPFHLTRRELSVSADEPDRYHLYRVFDFAKEPRLFDLRGNVADHVGLEPLLFQANLRST